MHIRTTKPSLIIHNGDTITTIKNRAILTLDRNKDPVSIISISDSIQNRTIINSKNSIGYYFNLFNLGIGMMIEKNKPKRYDYPWKIRINSSDTSTTYYRSDGGPKKGSLFLHLSLPHINSFYFSPDKEKAKSNTGFWGLSIGFDYFHTNNQFFNLSASAVSDFFVPIPAAIDISGEFELMTSTYLSLTNNHKVNHFSFGYGISFVKNTWDLSYIERFDPPPPTREPIKKSHYAFGGCFSSYYQLGRRFNLGLIFRPTFLRINTQNNLKYEHLISFDITWKIRLK